MSNRPKGSVLAIAILLLPTLSFAKIKGEEGGDQVKKPASQDTYTPPSTPDLYDVNEPLIPLYQRAKKVKSHPYIGLGLGAGLSRHDGGSGTQKLAWDLVAEGGYVKALSSWSRVEFGLELLNGQIGDSDNTIHVQLGGLAKVGYGYNIAQNLYGLVRAGFGFASASYSGPLSKDKSASGFLWQLAFQLILPTDSSVDVLGGVFFNQYVFSTQGVYNVFDVRLGLRYRI